VIEELYLVHNQYLVLSALFLTEKEFLKIIEQCALQVPYGVDNTRYQLTNTEYRQGKAINGFLSLWLAILKLVHSLRLVRYCSPEVNVMVNGEVQSDEFMVTRMEWETNDADPWSDEFPRDYTC
jgi:hypothetical protein